MGSRGKGGGFILTSAAESIDGQNIARLTGTSVGAIDVGAHMLTVVVSDALINI